MTLLLSLSGCAATVQHVPLAGRVSQAGFEEFVADMAALTPDDLVLALGQPQASRQLPSGLEAWTYDVGLYEERAVVSQQAFDWQQGRAVTVTTGGGRVATLPCEITFLVGKRRVEGHSSSGWACGRLFKTKQPAGKDCLASPKGLLLVRTRPGDGFHDLITVPRSRWRVYNRVGLPPKFPRPLAQIAVCAESPEGAYMFYAPSGYYVPLDDR